MTARAAEGESRLSVWALLDRRDEQRLAEVIAGLAARLETPVFRPHVTLLGRTTREAGAARGALERAARERSAFTVRLTSVSHSGDRFRAIVLECDPACDALYELHDALLASVGERAAGPFRPHVSLLYGTPDPATRRRVADEVSAQLAHALTVQALALVDLTGDVASWATLPPEVTLGA